MKIAIEAQRIFRVNKHGMDFVALEVIRELQKIDRVRCINFIILVDVSISLCGFVQFHSSGKAFVQ